MSLEGQTGPPEQASVWRRVMSTPERSILLAGVALALLYLVSVALTSRWSAELFQDLVTMTTTHIIGGRAAGISWGYLHQLPGWLVIVANLAVEGFLVMLFYPLFVFSYRKLIIIAPLRNAMARTQLAAEAHRAQIIKYGIPGLLLFVWFPFWMTGPLVGSVIGFLIGLRPWVNMAVVLTGTGLATVCWGLVLQHVYERLKALGPYVPFFFVGLVLFAAIAIHIRYAFARNEGEPEERDSNQSEK